MGAPMIGNRRGRALNAGVWVVFSTKKYKVRG
jgi:hypothetical protein